MLLENEGSKEDFEPIVVRLIILSEVLSGVRLSEPLMLGMKNSVLGIMR